MLLIGIINSWIFDVGYNGKIVVGIEYLAKLLLD